MTPVLPEGIAWPADGVPDPAVVGKTSKNLSLYIHVPFCKVRCGYCDFNTYTVGFGEGADISSYHQSVFREIDLAAQVLAPYEHNPVQSVFVGGGTPTMLDAQHLAEVLGYARTKFSFAPNCEVTTEANPDSVDARSLETLAAGGFTRVSFGMQSAVKQVLRTLDRTHDPKRIQRVVKWAQQAGMDTSLDLIYGTPGESLVDWEASLSAALSAGTEHISTYALVIEEGTKMWKDVQRGHLPMPDPDDEAAKYELADLLLSEAGFAWYEISNWARLEPGESSGTTQLTYASVHNLAYWRDDDWWGIGPGAHSHLGNLRWWNRKHPRAWADALGRGESFLSPAQAGEELTAAERSLERFLLQIRTADGLGLSEVDPDLRGRIPALVGQELLTLTGNPNQGDAVLQLTLQGRLLADYVTRELTV
ncbi:putative oxygen-independent coproporphyrinogen III oxidase [Gleimia coleocanis DSM 15436]|uniref:Heme chaperone HemW n=1 Tax=Gleimia coleocanis DSM 15436 TaxID=525245 RepID=C0W087_9ACTO|nr:radical SAM family heme chaperone HemW [Gleimia coleocanis]EEH63946.1 putative oxygen-independent coproporphyrinogen III oxidase [Gleimia coleocanis DSM 15436]